MSKHLYLSLMPEALIASMLSPEEFGLYYTIGSDRKAHDHSMFIELDLNFRSEYFRIDEGLEKCVPHENGAPKKSVYISVYRVLEQVPLDVMKTLYMVTSYGEVLGLDASNEFPNGDGSAHMYQEIAPIQPLVVSKLGPKAFAHFISQDEDSFVHLPAIAFVELELGELAENPENGSIDDLPYVYIPHLRECLLELRTKCTQNKMVHRVHTLEFPFRMVKSGVFISKSNEGVRYFPLPSREQLRSEYYRWWRSANR